MNPDRNFFFLFEPGTSEIQTKNMLLITDNLVTDNNSNNNNNNNKQKVISV